MNILDEIFKEVPKDSKGFENIDMFFAAAEKLSFPLSNHLKSLIYNGDEEVAAEEESLTTDFDYDTSSTISYYEESLLFDDEEETKSPLPPTEDEVETEDQHSSNEEPSDTEEKPSQSTVKPSSRRSSAASSRKSTSALSPQSRRSSKASTHTAASDPSDDEEEVVNHSTLSSKRQSTNTSVNTSVNTSGRKSSVKSSPASRASIASRATTASSKSQKSASPASTNKSLSRSSPSPKTSPSTTGRSASRVSEASRTSPSKSVQDRTRTSVYSNSDLDVTGFPEEESAGDLSARGRRSSLVSRDVEQSLMFSAGSGGKSMAKSTPGEPFSEGGSAKKSGSSAKRRVSFGGDVDLSPIPMDESGEGDDSSRKQSLSFSKGATSLQSEGNGLSGLVEEYFPYNSAQNSEIQEEDSYDDAEDFAPPPEDDVLEESDVLEDSEEVEPEEMTKITPISVRSKSRNTSTGKSKKSSNISDLTDHNTSNSSLKQTPLSKLQVKDSFNSVKSKGSSKRSSVSSKKSQKFSDTDFEMPETPSHLHSRISTPGTNAFQRGIRLSDASYHQSMVQDDGSQNDEIETDVEDDFKDQTTVTDSSSFMDNSYLQEISENNRKYVEGKAKVRSTETAYSKEQQKNLKILGKRKSLLDQDEQEEESEEETGLRRSGRATQGRRFAFWKSERPVYDHGTIVGVLTAEPTPKKPKTTVKRGRKSKKTLDNDMDFEKETGSARKKKKNVILSDVASSPVLFSPMSRGGNSLSSQDLPTPEIPKDRNYLEKPTEAEVLQVWDEVNQQAQPRKVISCADFLNPPSALPKTAKRPRGKDGVGYAVHTFHVAELPGTMSGWISGFLQLPPESIKDAEGVGKYAQNFVVTGCHEGSLELGLAHPQKAVWEESTAQRVLLKKGDGFYLPPGNIYRLENHSKVVPAVLHWTIIKPLEYQLEDEEVESDSSEGKNTKNLSRTSNKSNNSKSKSVVEKRKPKTTIAGGKKKN